MIHLNIGSNLKSKYGDRFKNISKAINLFINSNLRINKISDYMPQANSTTKVELIEFPLLNPPASLFS